MEKLDSKTLKIMIASAANNIRNNVDKINDMNVFPVPDGDTGTNMSMTFAAAANEAVSRSDSSGVGEILECLAKSALRNARGNSGVILSQILRGIQKGADGCETVGAADIKNAVCSARDVAYRAVMKPTEGTILTVVREIAEYAEANFSEYTNALDFLKALYEAGMRSLESTPEILPVLKQAGVVDAGGCGLMTLLSGAVKGLEDGKPIELVGGASEIKSAASAINSEIDTANIKYKYCTEFLINKDSERNAAQFMAAIRPKGDCMLVIDDEEIVKVHIHTNHPGFVIEQAIKLGELTNLKIDNMKYQHNEKIGQSVEAESIGSEAAGEVVDFVKGTAAVKSGKKYAAVAVVSGSGMKELFESLDCDKIVEGGQSMNPSTQDILDAVESVDAEYVFVLPNNKNIILAAEQAAELTDKNVIVIPTKNMPQGISAMAVIDDGVSPEENTEAMNEAAACVNCGQITYAARNSRMNGLDIHEGDIMAVIGSDVSFVGIDMEEVALRLVRELVNNDCGMISIYYGDDVTEEAAAALGDKAADEYSALDVSVNYGGQAVYSYIISAE